MSHFIHVSDPWFGSYLSLHLTSSALGEVTILVGPLFERVISTEMLRNHGERHYDRRFSEKPCQHSYVEGSISGELPDGYLEPKGSKQLIPLASKSTDIIVPDNTIEGWVYSGKIMSTCSEAAGGLSVSLHIDWTYQSVRPDGWICVDEHHFCDVNLLRTEQPDGAKAYTLVSSTPWTCEVALSNGQNITYSSQESGASQVSNPFGSGGDCLALVLPQLMSYALEQRSRVERAGKEVTVSDAVIYDALENISLANFNPLNDFSDLLDILGPLKQLRDLLKVHGVVDLIKKFASMHLFYKYVVKTNIMTAGEFKKLFNALRHPEIFFSRLREMKLIGRGRITEVETEIGGTEVTTVTSVKLVYSAATTDIFDLLNILGLTPRMADLWDIVPYSFVIDWLLPLGDAMNNLELQNIQQRLPFEYMMASQKVKRHSARQMLVDNHVFDIDLIAVSYGRRVSHEFPTDMWFGVSFQDPRKHLLTGGALAIQAYVE